jgi:hypothetical protein
VDVAVHIFMKPVELVSAASSSNEDSAIGANSLLRIYHFIMGSTQYLKDKGEH